MKISRRRFFQMLSLSSLSIATLPLYSMKGIKQGKRKYYSEKPIDLTSTPEWTLPDSFMKSVKISGPLGWPKERPEARPGAYWWWPGSAVTKKDLTWNLETYHRAGWGNMGVIGIYGVKGEEENFIDVFSPQWFDMFNHALKEAERLNMNIDLTPSSGWRWGGPHVTEQYGEQSFSVKEGRIQAEKLSAKVKRAGPGGKGLCINPYSPAAVNHHLNWFEKKFKAGQGVPPRAFYYDSFENPGNWCPELPGAFRKLRGYKLEDYAEALGGEGETEKVRRVICDYRETLSDLLIGRVRNIVRWAENYGSGLRMQAHGAPANLLDMYGAAEFPETEIFGANKFDISGYRRDPKWCRYEGKIDLINQFASSAGHVTGKNVIISESFTWLRNHYHTALSHIKAEADNLFINGINGIFYHGICYTPQNADWPGWLFYASTQANYRNSIFRDIPVLNAYITRCQSELQSGRPYNDVLLYWPLYDLWMGDGNEELRFPVHHTGWIEGTPCGEAAHWMIRKGYTFDFLSDKQLEQTGFKQDSLITAGDLSYRTLLIPAATYMKHATFQYLVGLAEKGATVLVWKQLPKDVPGWYEHDSRRQKLMSLQEGLSFDSKGVAKVGSGQLILSDHLEHLLAMTDIDREPIADTGLRFIRRKWDKGISYFISNQTAGIVDGWTGLGSSCKSAVLMDPMNGHASIAPVRKNAGQTQVYLQLESGESRILRVYHQEKVEGEIWPVLKPIEKEIPVRGTWRVDFVEGGPVLPEGFTTDTLKCWTQLGDEDAARFAGAARYKIRVEIPDTNADHWILDLGDVRESARIWVNGRPAGVLVAHPFRINVTAYLKTGENELSIEVTNLSANRIRDLDSREVEWKKFYDINFVSHDYEEYNAAEWDLKPSGLLGPVKFMPYRIVNT